MGGLELALRNAGRVDEACRLVPRHLAAWMKTYGPRNEFVQSFVLRRLHQFAITDKRPDDAARFALDRLTELRDRDHISPDSSIVGTMLLALADARLAQDRPTEAEQPLHDATAILGRATPTTVHLWRVHRELGAAYRRQKKLVEAEAEFLLADEGITKRGVWEPSARQECRLVRGALVALYTEWAQPVKAGEWRQKLEAIDREEPSLHRAGAPLD
jgi:hypothetical protein